MQYQYGEDPNGDDYYYYGGGIGGVGAMGPQIIDDYGMEDGDEDDWYDNNDLADRIWSDNV